MQVNGPGTGVRTAYQLAPVERPAPAVELGTVARPAPSAPAAVEAVPAGGDPALWAILTSEERRFFLRQAALGPLTYGPGNMPTGTAADAPLGQRIDVRA